MNFPVFELPLVRGLIAGFALAAPIGPVGVLCIRRALTHGVSGAFLAGLGAAIADTFFGAAAGLGMTIVSSFIAAHTIALGLLGGFVVIGLGIATWFAPAVPVHDLPPARTLHRDFTASFVMAITNPATMLAAAGVFAAYGTIDPRVEWGAALLLIAGLFAGSGLWWLTLASLVARFRERFIAHLQWLNRGSAVLLGAFGAAMALAALAASRAP